MDSEFGPSIPVSSYEDSKILIATEGFFRQTSFGSGCEVPATLSPFTKVTESAQSICILSSDLTNGILLETTSPSKPF